MKLCRRKKCSKASVMFLSTNIQKYHPISASLNIGYTNTEINAKQCVTHLDYLKNIYY